MKRKPWPRTGKRPAVFKFYDDFIGTTRSPLTRSKPIRKISQSRQRSMMCFRRLVMAKNDGLCVFCEYTNNIVHPASDPHHWLPRGRGGKDDPANGLPICRVAHDIIHTQPKWAEANGWLLITPEKNPAAQAIETWVKNKSSRPLTNQSKSD